MQVGLGILQTMRPEATATPGDSILTDSGHLLILLWAVVLSSCRVPSYADPGLLRVSPRCRRPTGWSRPRPRDVGMVVMPERRLALGRYEVTVGEYRAFAAATAGGAGGGCDASLFVTPDSWRDPGHPQTDRHPRDPPQLGRRSGVRILAEPRDGRGASLAERKRSGHGRLPGLSPAATSTERTREARAWSAPTAPSRPACRTWCRMSLSGHRIAGRATAGAVCSAATLGAAVPVSRAPTRATAPPPLVAGPLPAFVSRGYWIDSCNADRWWFLNAAFATVNRRPLIGPYHDEPHRGRNRLPTGARQVAHRSGYPRHRPAARPNRNRCCITDPAALNALYWGSRPTHAPADSPALRRTDPHGRCRKLLPLGRRLPPPTPAPCRTR